MKSLNITFIMTDYHFRLLLQASANLLEDIMQMLNVLLHRKLLTVISYSTAQNVFKLIVQVKNYIIHKIIFVIL